MSRASEPVRRPFHHKLIFYVFITLTLLLKLYYYSFINHKRSINMHKTKLTIEQQIDDMKSKGVCFNTVTEQDAIRYLKFNCYYFKLKAYERNFEVYHSTAKKGQYINLDFAYIQELYELDNILKSLIISMATDIEHALKIRILNDVIANSEEDGYSIVNKFLSEDFVRVKAIREKVGKTTLTDLIKSHISADDTDIDEYALWEIVEVLSLGSFIELYELYYGTYHSSQPNYTSFLKPVKILRNAAAHNNCLLNSIRKPYNVSISATKEMMTLLSRINGITKETRNKWMANPLIHDFIVLVFLYLQVVKDSKKKQACIQALDDLFFSRMLKNKDYFIKNNVLCECYHFTSRVVQYFCNKYRK